MAALPMVDRFFHYTFLNQALLGSEHPAVFGRATPIIEHFVKSLGVRAILTLTPGFQDFRFPGLVQHHVPIRDMPSRKQVAEAVEIVGAHLRLAEPMWVHCQHGLDRTGCVIGSYASIGQSPDEVVAELYGKFPERRRTALMIKLWKPYKEMIRSFAKA